MELTLQAMKTLSELMDQALDLDGEERTRWLDDLATGPHAALQPYLADMLARQSNMETAFLLSPVSGPVSSRSVDAASDAFASGTRVGPYVLEREIGQGGMGSVWLAARDDGTLTRRVALKLPMLQRSRSLAERFARERDILAQLTHPNIARLYDAGVTDDGQPYLALEYIEGKPITEHCDGINLPVAERLRRFSQVAAAVQYAHANLVIHRDLKPGNILVSEDGQVHLLDFGIAKLLDDPTAQATESELTMIAGRALTLDYASPEQVNGQAISTASDVYSMGVVLYQLLTGQKPYQLKRGSRAELEEAIVTGEAMPMSDAARRCDDATAAQHGLSKDRLARALAGDLDTIVAKAMKKDPQQRYATVAAFAEDIQRHLDGLPVEAQPDSWRYRAGKFVARNRVGVMATGAIAIALIAGFGTALWQADVATRNASRADNEAVSARNEKSRADSEATAARRESQRADEQAQAARDAAARADEEAALARREAKRADLESVAAKREATRADQEARLARRETVRGNAVQGYLVDLFSANSNDQKNAVQVRNLTAKQLLDRGADKLEGSKSLPEDVNAALYRLFGELYETVYDLDRSMAMHQRSVQAASSVYGKASREYALALMELAWVARERRSGTPVFDQLDEAKAILARIAPNSDDYAQALYFEASFYALTKPERAVRAAQESLRIMDQNGGSNRRKAFAERSLGYALRAAGDFRAAADAFSKAADSFAKLYGADGVEVGMTRTILAECLRQELRMTEAEREAALSVDILKAYRGNVILSEATGQRWLRVMAERGRLRDAEKSAEEVHRSMKAVDTRTRDDKTGVALLLTDFALSRGDAEAAQKILDALEPNPQGSHLMRLGVYMRRGRAALQAADLRAATQIVDQAKELLAERGAPIDFVLGVSLVAAELAAAQGDAQRALAEYADFQRRFPMKDYAPLMQFVIVMSKARGFARLSQWSDVEATLAPWLEPGSSSNRELPQLARAEALLLAGEAAQRGVSKAQAEARLRAAAEILRLTDASQSGLARRVDALLAVR